MQRKKPADRRQEITAHQRSVVLGENVYKCVYKHALMIYIYSETTLDLYQHHQRLASALCQISSKT